MYFADVWQIGQYFFLLGFFYHIFGGKVKKNLIFRTPLKSLITKSKETVIFYFKLHFFGQNMLKHGINKCL